MANSQKVLSFSAALLLHALLLAYFCRPQSSSCYKKMPQPLTVQTFSLKNKKNHAAPCLPSPEQAGGSLPCNSPRESKKNAVSEKKKKKAAPRTEIEEAKKAGEKKGGDKRRGLDHQALEKAQQTLGQVCAAKDGKQYAPPSLDLGQNGPENERCGAASYATQLSRRLQDMLCLPEHGDVVFHLVLTPQGKILELKILNSLSEKNAAYVQRALQGISFPALDDKTVPEEYSFNITLFSD